MSQDNCALNQDSSLKDASEIQWFNDVDNETLLSQPRPSKTNLKPSKMKRARLASFLDLEAKVASGSEDEDPIDSDGDFINDFTDDEDNNIDHPCLSLTQAIEAEHGFIDHLTNKYIEKSWCVGNHSGRDGNPMFSTHKHGIARSSITPQDWLMFDILVKEGSEEIIVHMLTTQAGPKHIHSVFVSAMIPGHVYVEGHNLEDVKKVLYKKASKKRAAGSSKSKVVPLPPCNSFNVNCTQEISPGELLVQYEDAEKKVIKGYIFQNLQYTLDGFIVRRKLDTDDYYQVNAMPTINELQSFKKCRQIPADVMELSQRTSLSSNIKIGDQVKIMLEGGKEYLAFMEDIEGENVSLNLVEFPMQVFSQSLELLQKFFKVGDGIRVKSGEHKGRVGMVTTVECNGKIGNETITFVAFPLGEANHLRIRSSDLDHCNEVQQSTTFQWPDGKMQVDPYQYQYGKYAWVRCGPLKGTRGILKSVSTSNVAQLEVPECLMFSKDLVECPMKDLYIPGYSDKSMNDFFTAETTGKNTEPALGVCSTPRWEHDSGIGSQTPAWNSSSMTPQVASASSDTSAEPFAFAHCIPENTALSFPLQPSATLPASMRMAVVSEGSAQQPTAFDGT
ncbi:hypothetical protein BDQ17DRAFT_1426793 [Cyathus striatus]|nr:hypothetical protein BDQ17DRAFT_1426793 [Cyathus striatus]